MITTICQALCGEGVEQQTVVGVAKRETPWLGGGDGWLYGSGVRYRCGDAGHSGQNGGQLFEELCRSL